MTSAVPGQSTEAQLREDNEASTKRFLDSFTDIELSVDGARVPDLKAYMAETPLFTIVLPANNLLGVAVSVGKEQRVAAVGEGYFFLLPPLSAGKHVVLLHVERTDPASGNVHKITYTQNLIVLDPNDPLP